MVEFNPILRKAYWLLAASGLIYVSIVCSLTFPEVQRFAVYLNKLNPTIWEDVNLVESFGFLKTQVQPFNLVTPDNETIYGWHLLPLHMCNEHAAELDMNKPAGPANDYTSTPAFKLLANDPNARVVVSFHGNAGHLGSAQRPETYRMLLGLSSSTNPIHVFSIDYRGFGLSTGTPTEEGLITDGVALLNFLTSSPLNISPSRITIVGQSLGTAVSAAVAERFLFGSSNPNAVQSAIKHPEPFAGVILMASFSNIPNLIESYSVKGITPPILSPLRGYPRIQNWARSHIVDRWDTAARVARLTGADGNMARSNSTYANKGLKLVILHAENDIEIPWYEGVRVFEAATNISHPRKVPSIRSSIWEANPDKSALVKEVLWKKVYYGGHNRIATFSEAAFEVLRTFHR